MVYLPTIEKLFLVEAPKVFDFLRAKGFFLKQESNWLLVAESQSVTIRIELHFSIVVVSICPRSVSGIPEQWVDLKTILQYQNPDLLKQYQVEPRDELTIVEIIFSRAEMLRSCEDILNGQFTDWEKYVEQKKAKLNRFRPNF